MLAAFLIGCGGDGGNGSGSSSSSTGSSSSGGDFDTYETTYTLPDTIPDNAIYVDTNHASASDGNPGTAALPFATISAALDTAGPGDTVVVKAGEYRETLHLPSGDTNQPFTLMAAPGERVIVSNMTDISGWQLHAGNIYRVDLNWRPGHLFVDYKEQPLSSDPEGWWASQTVVNDDQPTGINSIVDPPHLQWYTNSVSGAQAFVWTNHGNNLHTVDVDSLDTASGTLNLVKNSQWFILTDGDRYKLQNSVDFIDQPGEWAVETISDTQYRLYFYPENAGDLNNTMAPQEATRIVLANNVNNAKIVGLEVAGNTTYGVHIINSENVTLAKCVIHQNSNAGALIRDSQDIIVSKNIFYKNKNGLVLHAVNNALIEHNDIGYGTVDGLIVTWNSNDITVRKNYLHHHLLWGHPDNMQIFRTVNRIAILDNLMLSAGQNIMMEEVDYGKLHGNVIIGSEGNSVVFGHNNANSFTIRNNTLTFPGYSIFSFSGTNYDLASNIIYLGHDTFAYSVREVVGYTGNHNLSYSATDEDDAIFVTDSGWGRTLSDLQTDTGQDGSSQYGDPRFTNMPGQFAALDSSRLHECTRSLLVLRSGNTDRITVGDIVEYNFDGVGRTVTAIAGDTITISPALDHIPLRDGMIVNWLSNPNQSLDTRLEADSPAIGLSATGANAGSSINIQAYMQGDFNGDGTRDIPVMPDI